MTITYYKLHHSTDNTKECYVGSATNYAQRKSDHKFNCNHPNNPKYNYKVYVYVRGNGGFDEWKFTILEQRTDPMLKQERFKHERELTVQQNATLNGNKAGTWTEAGGRMEYARIYFNTPEWNEYNRLRRHTTTTCDRCGGLYRNRNMKARHQRTHKCRQLTEERARLQEQMQVLLEQMVMFNADTVSRINEFKAALHTLTRA